MTHIFRVSPDAKPKSCILADAKPKRKPVEYRLHWVPGVGSLHVHFIFFVLISFALGSRRKRSFQWNMGYIYEDPLEIGKIGADSGVEVEVSRMLL